MVGWACGHNFPYFRSRQDGHWIFPQQTQSIWVGWRNVPNDNEHHPTGSVPNELLPLYSSYLTGAQRLVDKLKMPRECIVITHVPAADDLRSLASFLGNALGLTVINPEVENLYTFDKAHLTPESSVRWTQAFLRELEPVLERCMNQSHRANVASLDSRTEAHAPR